MQHQYTRKVVTCPVKGHPLLWYLREIIGMSPAVHVLKLLQVLPPPLLLVYPAHGLGLPPR